MLSNLEIRNLWKVAVQNLVNEVIALPCFGITKLFDVVLMYQCVF